MINLCGSLGEHWAKALRAFQLGRVVPGSIPSGAEYQCAAYSGSRVCCEERWVGKAETSEMRTRRG